MSALEQELRSAAYQAFQTMIRDPSVQILGVDVATLCTPTFDSHKERSCYVVTVATNSSAYLRGDNNAFKGSYKERVEGLLDSIVKRSEPSGWAHVEITGAPGAGVERLVPIRRLVSSGVLSDDSPLVMTAKRYEIPAALLRGRHFIGPSPAIASLCESLSTSQSRPTTVLEIFAGTAIASRVLLSHLHLTRVVIVERDPRRIKHIGRYLRGQNISFIADDACRAGVLPESDFDLVVADPYYEDALTFLSTQLAWIKRRAGKLLLITGGIENLHWNQDTARRLKKEGLHPKEHSLFGQCILEVTINRTTRRKLFTDRVRPPLSLRRS